MRGIDFFGDEEVADHEAGMLGRYLENSFASILEKHSHLHERLYFMLVDLARRNVKVPKLAVNAIILSCGRLSKVDKAFATFQEYDLIFKLGQPKRSTFNSLLGAVARSSAPSSLGMLSVMQDMDDANAAAVAKGSSAVTPDSLTHALLLEVLAQKLDAAIQSGDQKERSSVCAIVDELVEMLSSQSHCINCIGGPLARSLRRLVIVYTKAGDETVATRLMSLLGYDDEGDNVVPRHFKNRLQALKRNPTEENKSILIEPTSAMD